MPIQVSNINQKAIYTDIDGSFTKNPKTRDLLLIKNESCIRNSLTNLLQTSFGERLFNSRIGGSLRNLLFEPIDFITTYEMKDRIISTITNHEPRVKNVLVDVVASEDTNSYTIFVEYSIKELPNSVGKTSIVLERIR